MTWFNYIGMAMPKPSGYMWHADLLVDDQPSIVDEFQWSDRGAYYHVTNVMNGRGRQEQQRLDRWSNVRRAKRARELDRRRARS